MTSLIVPRGLGTGKPGRRDVENPFARIVRGRARPNQQRYRGPVWRGVGPDAAGLVEAPGRKVGRTAGGYIDDLCQLRKSIVLCDVCQSRFYYRRAHYYRDERYGACVLSNCDGCREYTARGRLYLPEERLVDASGMARPGQVWRPA